MVHRRVAVFGGSDLTPAPTRHASAGSRWSATAWVAGLAGGDACGRSAATFRRLSPAHDASGDGLGNVACAGAASGNVAFAAAGGSLDDEYVAGPRHRWRRPRRPMRWPSSPTPVAHRTSCGVVRRRGPRPHGHPRAVRRRLRHAVAGHGPSGAPRPRVPTRVREPPRPGLAHPSAVVVAFAPPTPWPPAQLCVVRHG